MCVFGRTARQQHICNKNNELRQHAHCEKDTRPVSSPSLLLLQKSIETFSFPKSWKPFLIPAATRLLLYVQIQSTLLFALLLLLLLLLCGVGGGIVDAKRCIISAISVYTTYIHQVHTTEIRSSRLVAAETKSWRLSSSSPTTTAEAAATSTATPSLVGWLAGSGICHPNAYLGMMDWADVAAEASSEKRRRREGSNFVLPVVVVVHWWCWW